MARDLPNNMTIKPRDMKRALTWANTETDPKKEMPLYMRAVIFEKNQWKIKHADR